MSWTSIDTIEDLRQFDRMVFWEDTTTREVFALGRNESYFPDDISRSGYHNHNVHILVDAEIENRSHLHIVLIDCERYTSGFIENPSFEGTIDMLKRIEIGEHDHYVRMRCSRLIYRMLELPSDFGDQSYLAMELGR